MYNIKQIYLCQRLQNHLFGQIVAFMVSRPFKCVPFFFIGTNLLTNCGEAIREKITDCVDK